MRKRWLQRVARAGTLVEFVGSAITACQNVPKDSDRDLGKALEHGAYDSLASIFSDYSNALFDKGLWIQRTRREERREIRHSPIGRYGPSPPSKPKRDSCPLASLFDRLRAHPALLPMRKACLSVWII
jgi:hypothetical protein